MADDLADFPIVVLENDYPEQVGKIGLFDYLMPVVPTGIVFVAAVPGRLYKQGPRFTDAVRRASNLRAASTLVQMGLIRGESFAFLRNALGLTQAEVAAIDGVPASIVDDWETNAIPVPRSIWACLAFRVCVADGRTLPPDYALPPPNWRPRKIRVFPNIPTPLMPQDPTPPCDAPPPLVGPDCPPPCPPEPPLC